MFLFSLVRDRNGDDACPRRVFNIGLFNYRYGGHIELVRFKEYYGMPGGHKHILIYSLSISVPLLGHFFLTFSLNKIVMGKKIVVQWLDVKMTAFFPRNIQCYTTT